MDKPASVRIAGPQDEAAIYAFLQFLHHENPPGIPWNAQIVLDRIAMGTRGGGGMIGVIEDEGQIVGSCGIYRQTLGWFTDAECGRELWLFVRAFARRSTHHYRDLFQFMRWYRDSMRELIKAEDPNYPYPFEVITGPTSNDRLELKDRLWARFGRKVGSLYILT